MAIILKNSHEIKLMRNSGRLAQRILNQLGAAAQAGVSTHELDLMARRYLEEAGATSPFLGYGGRNHPPFPGAICTSVNEAVVHGVPTKDPLKNGDIVALDVGAKLQGWLGDTAGTFPVGEISTSAQRLLRVTKEALYLGIEQAKVGNRVGDIAHAVQTHIENHGYHVVRDLVGHGVGRSLHEEPSVPNFGSKNSGPKLRAGMTFAIEPMVNAGTAKVIYLDDGWTCLSADRSLSAHFEHTIAVLSDGPEILTLDE